MMTTEIAVKRVRLRLCCVTLARRNVSSISLAYSAGLTFSAIFEPGSRGRADLWLPVPLPLLNISDDGELLPDIIAGLIEPI